MLPSLHSHRPLGPTVPPEFTGRDNCCGRSGRGGAGGKRGKGRRAVFRKYAAQTGPTRSLPPRLRRSRSPGSWVCACALGGPVTPRTSGLGAELEGWRARPGWMRLVRGRRGERVEGQPERDTSRGGLEGALRHLSPVGGLWRGLHHDSDSDLAGGS